MTTGELSRIAAFTRVPTGGNPAGVWVGESLPDQATMLAIAARVGYSETAFIAPACGLERSIRYFSPEAEVEFCGHATIASGYVLGESEGDATFRLSTLVGTLELSVSSRNEVREAAVTTVEPKQRVVAAGLLVEVLAAIRWKEEQLDSAIPPMLAYAGAWHLVLAAKAPWRLAALDYDFEALKAIMLREGIVTLQLILRESEHVFHSRNLFPVGGVVEDPATGAAAAALGGYLRASCLISVPAVVTIHQGVAMGRPSLIQVEIAEKGGITIRGSAVRIEHDCNGTGVKFPDPRGVGE